MILTGFIKVWTSLIPHISIQVLSMKRMINLNYVIHFRMGNALSQKLIICLSMTTFIQYPLNATITCRKSQTPKACFYWNTVLSVFHEFAISKKLNVLTQKQWRQNQASSKGHEGKWTLLHRSLLQGFLQVIQKYIFQ